MVIKDFVYKSKPRRVAVVEESATNIKGFDLSYCDSQEKLEEAIKLCESIETETSQKMETEKFEQCKHLMVYFRNFKKSEIRN